MDQTELYKKLDSHLVPDKNDKLNFGAVFTPMSFVEKMLDSLPSHLWSDKNLTWLDPACGIGNFPIAIYFRLMKGLASIIPNERKRRCYILKRMIYMSELNKSHLQKCKSFLDPHSEFKLNIYCGDSLAVKFSKFDVIVGNPPYNCGLAPLYHKFIEKFIDRCKYLLFIVPSRWFSGGKGLNKFRASMLARNDIRFINHFDNASDIFKGVSISGGVNYFLRDSNWNGLCNFNGSLINLNRHDVLIDSKFYELIDEFKNEPKLTDIYQGRCYGIETNDSRLLNHSEPGAIRCFVSQKKGFNSFIKCKADGYWKVITARATGGTKRFAHTFIGKPNEIHSGSYISWRVNSLNEAKSLLSYLKCKLPNLLLSLRMNSHNLSKDSMKWVPLPVLDRMWTDEKVYKLYDFNAT